MAFWAAIGFSFNAPQQARLTKMWPEQVTTLLALNASAIYVGTTVGSAIAGVVLLVFSPSVLAVVGGVVAVVALFAYLMSCRRADSRTQ